MLRKRFVLILFLLCWPLSAQADQQITDAWGRTHALPDRVKHVICSGPGCLRLLTYLQAQDTAVAVDSIESRHTRIDARPYALAHPEFKQSPIFGTFRGRDNPERILALNPAPQVIFKTYGQMGMSPDNLQQKTGLPVIALNYGNLLNGRAELNQALRLMGRILNRQQRAEEVIAYFDQLANDLRQRAAHATAAKPPRCYVGGIAFKGPHGLESTETSYPPFTLLQAENLAAKTLKHGQQTHATVAREQLIAWDPDWIFIDLSTLRLGEDQSALATLKNHPAYRGITALKQGRVYGVLPYNWYTRNFGSIFADAYGIGTILYPEAFADIDPAAKSDEIYRFLVGKPVFSALNAAFDGQVFSRLVPLN